MYGRQEFSAKTKKQAWERANGHCEECGIELNERTGVEYDHVIECAINGDNSLSNCLCLCRTCHRAKTGKRAPTLAKTERNWRKSRGIRKRSRFPGSRDSGLKKKLNGTVERR